MPAKLSEKKKKELGRKIRAYHGKKTLREQVISDISEFEKDFVAEKNGDGIVFKNKNSKLQNLNFLIDPWVFSDDAASKNAEIYITIQDDKSVVKLLLTEKEWNKENWDCIRQIIPKIDRSIKNKNEKINNFTIMHGVMPHIMSPEILKRERAKEIIDEGLSINAKEAGELLDYLKERARILKTGKKYVNQGKAWIKLKKEEVIEMGNI